MASGGSGAAGGENLLFLTDEQLRKGIEAMFFAYRGFTADPETFLINLDAPYAFNDWFSFGPAMQIGFTDNRTVVSPTGNLRVTIPDLPGRAFDRVHPYGIAGMGFTVIENAFGLSPPPNVANILPFTFTASWPHGCSSTASG